MSDRRITAIIPAYNEEKTVGAVVRALKQSELVEEVLVVSDGSTDRTRQEAEAEGAIVYELPTKGGKGAAMMHGVTFTEAPVIAFFDADLIGLTPDHVERLALPVTSGSKAMNVGIRDRGKLFSAVTRYLPLVGGERVMLRSVFEGVPPKYMQGFMVESALNYYCRSRELAYGKVFLPGLTIRRKYEKVGLVQGAKQYLRMWWQVGKAMTIVRTARLMKKF